MEDNIVPQMQLRTINQQEESATGSNGAEYNTNAEMLIQT